MGLVRLPPAPGPGAGGDGGSPHAARLEAALDAKVDRVFMPHGVGHFLGLDVHDVSDAGPVPKGPLRAGYVVTVEPGAYLIRPLLAKARADPAQAAMVDVDLAERLMAGGLGGVRIEDNVAVVALPPHAAADAAGPGAGAGAQREGGGRCCTLLNLTEAAGVAKEVADVEAVMGQEWAPGPAMELGAQVLPC
jgi:Xaa-Pro aminopeptidase